MDATRTDVPPVPIQEISPSLLHDSFARSFHYLRLSLTDACNYRCRYCLPQGYRRCGEDPFLTLDEIRRLVGVFSELGIRKIRLTGGEPTVRRDFTDIAAMIAACPRIETTALTTNGYRLRDNARIWRQAGINALNVSVDSLRPDRFRHITGHDRLPEVLAGIDAALDAGFAKVKVNAVLLKDGNDDELDAYLDWTKETPVNIRFIELMRTGDNVEYFERHHLSADTVIRRLERTGWTVRSRVADAGPAREYQHPDHMGSVGLIAPYSKDFCKGCNRLRVTSTGDLRLCLFGDYGIGLRHLLQNDEQNPVLKQLITNQLRNKPAAHFLASGHSGMTRHLASVGG